MSDALDNGFVLLATVLVVSVLVVGMVSATEPPRTYTADHSLEADSTDGQPVTVAYEVSYEPPSGQEDFEHANEKMARVSSCTTDTATSYIQSHTVSEVKQTNWVEVLGSCETDTVTIRNFIFSWR